MEAAFSIVAILFLSAACILMVMAMLRMFKGTAPPRGQRGVPVRDHMRLGKLARSGREVSEEQAGPVREVVEQQLDTLERKEAARPLMIWALGLGAVGTTLFAVGSDRDMLPLLRSFAVFAAFWLVSTTFMGWVLRKYEATAEANGWITYSD